MYNLYMNLQGEALHYKELEFQTYTFEYCHSISLDPECHKKTKLFKRDGLMSSLQKVGKDLMDLFRTMAVSLLKHVFC